MCATINSSIQKLRFSGHESFVCRLSWLRKGLEFVSRENFDFNAPEAVIDLGVGKNMVSSIRFWLRAFGLTDETDHVADLGLFFWDPTDSPKDPFFEMEGTIWLLHYRLVEANYASIFSFFFQEFQNGRLQFTEAQLLKALLRKCQDHEQNVAQNTLERDIAILFRSYLSPEIKGKSDIEDVFSGVLHELQLIKKSTVGDNTGKEVVYRISREKRPSLPWEVVLYTILKNLQPNTTSISFKEIMHGQNSPGKVFLLSKDGLLEKIDEIVAHSDGKIIFSQTAGNEVLQFPEGLNDSEVLNGYYDN
jgi:hypothetical protein